MVLYRRVKIERSAEFPSMEEQLHKEFRQLHTEVWKWRVGGGILLSSILTVGSHHQTLHRHNPRKRFAKCSFQLSLWQMGHRRSTFNYKCGSNTIAVFFFSGFNIWDNELIISLGTWWSIWAWQKTLHSTTYSICRRVHSTTYSTCRRVKPLLIFRGKGKRVSLREHVQYDKRVTVTVWWSSYGVMG